MISSHNEWDQLKSIVVGDATDANWPVNDPVFAKEGEKTTWKETPVPRGPVPQRIIEETNEDLDKLCMVLSSLGVEVLRPDHLNFQTHDGMYNYCPRDRLLVVGSTVVDPAMMYPCRDMEIQCYHSILQQADRVLEMPRKTGMVLDAANVLKLNDTLLFLESTSGNKPAAEWLQSQFPDYKVETCNFYSGVHIDSTIVPLREGLVLLNATRVTEENCPKVFANWEKIYVDEVEPQEFYQYPYASKWIALNMLVVDPQTVICDAGQKRLHSILESKGFTVIPQTLRHSRTLGGGFHCVTLDLWRQAQ